MSEHDRRTFLKRAAAVPGAALVGSLGGCAPEDGAAPWRGKTEPVMRKETCVPRLLPKTGKKLVGKVTNSSEN